MDFVFKEYQDIIPDFARFEEGILRPFPTHLRVNRLRIEPPPLVRLLEESGIHCRRCADSYDDLLLSPGLESPGNTLEYFLGYIHPQAFTSCLASLALSPRPHSMALDLCSAPGGKTSHMAQLMLNTGLMVANEPYPGRRQALVHTVERLGVLNTVVTGYHAQEFPIRQRFDFVLADVPCSGEGAFRKGSGNSRWQGDYGRDRLVRIQKRIIVRGYDLLKEGGVMLYSTCTYSPLENEAVVDFLLKNREAHVLPIEVQARHSSGICEWKGDRYDPQLARACRFYPHDYDSVGFFMARIGRG